MVLTCAAAVVFGVPSLARAAGVVGTGTLASCTDAALIEALHGGGLVTFDCGGSAIIDISSGTGTKTIDVDTTIDGAGLITISGGNSVRVFRVNAGATLMVANLIIADGHVADEFPGALWGGAIESAGALVVTNSTFAGNRAGVGGAIASGSGPVTVTDSTFIANRASLSGGAIDNRGVLTIARSTFSSNSGGIGGAIASGPGSLAVANSTFAGNTAANNGGAISNGIRAGSGSLSVINCTFTANAAPTGGGIANVSPGVLVNTLLADNDGGGNCFGEIADGGHNLEDGTSCGFSASKGSLSGTNPQLDAAGLRDNGGPTQTVALSPASPAIAAGDQAACDAAPVHKRDQRGLVRPGAGHTQCSIGAYESDAVAPESCTGDCDEDGATEVHELILGVRIALGLRNVSACPAFATADDAVTIAELITAVGNALAGCSRDPDECSDEFLSRDCPLGTVCVCCCGSRQCLPLGSPIICCDLACSPPRGNR
jgi:hypothetical protein